MGVLAALKQRRDARRWQRWSEDDPMDELHHRARFGIALVLTFFALVIALVVVGLVVAR